MGIGVWQVVLVLVIILINLGDGEMRKVMSNIAKSMKNLKSRITEEVTDSSNETKPVENSSAQVAESAENKEDSVKS